MKSFWGLFISMFADMLIHVCCKFSCQAAVRAGWSSQARTSCMMNQAQTQTICSWITVVIIIHSVGSTHIRCTFCWQVKLYTDRLWDNETQCSHILSFFFIYVLCVCIVTSGFMFLRSNSASPLSHLVFLRHFVCLFVVIFASLCNHFTSVVIFM